MRVALISDLHANEVALAAVLNDIRRAGVDQIVCLGDVATLGPHPNVVLQILRDLKCACIEGNHDAFMLDEQLIHTYTEAPVVVDAVDWCRDRLSADELNFVRSFHSTLQIDLGGSATLVLFHGTPRSFMEDMLATTPPEDVDRMLDGKSGTVLAGGHTHIQMLRQHRGMLLVNPGSVGLPFKEHICGRAPTLLGHSEYAIVEAERGAVNISLRRVPLDKQRLRAAVAPSDNPMRDMLMQQYA
jgi:predicted phosphodiesterase